MPTFDTPHPLVVDIELGAGDVRLVASDRADTNVEVRPSDRSKRDDVTAAEQTRIELDAGRLLVKVPKTWRRYSWFSDGGSVDIVVELPTGSQVGMDAGMAALHESGRLGPLRCKTGMGDVDIDEVSRLDLRTGFGDVDVIAVAGRSDVSTGSGAVRIGSVDGPAEIKNSNGDTRIGAVTGDVRVRASNGDIVIERCGAAVTAKSANGAIRVGAVEQGATTAETACGDVAIGIAEGTAAWLDVHTQYGHVHNRLDETDAAEPGERTAEVRATTACGDITIHRSPRADRGVGTPSSEEEA